MKMETFYKVLKFLGGATFSLILTVVTIVLVVTYTSSSFAYGKKVGDELVETKESKEVIISVPKEATNADIGEILKTSGIINNVPIYRLECLLKGVPENVKEGEYTLNMSMDTNEINETLRMINLATADVKITILEGYSTADIASYLENKEIVKAEDFIKACNEGVFDYTFLKDIPARENRLEGYLFPDTYFIAQGATSEDIIDKMLARFDEIYSKSFKLGAQEAGLSMDQVVTMASIIEKEVRLDQERSKVSAVIKNRLAQNMNLQMCSTIIYILDKRKDRLTDEDLKVKSPYNTYTNEGLPIGPICNPGFACLSAVLNPELSEDLYFVLKDETTGEHVFTSSYDEFVAAKEEFKQKF